MRQKTALRKLLDSYFSETDPDLKQDWLSIKYLTERDINKIRSMLYSMKVSYIYDIDRINKIFWILRKD